MDWSKRVQLSSSLMSFILKLPDKVPNLSQVDIVTVYSLDVVYDTSV